MVTLAPDPLAIPDPTRPPAFPEAPGLPQVLDSFAEVIEAIDSEATLGEILHIVARKICLLIGCRRCGVYLKHSETGLYRGEALESSRDEGDDRIRRLMCGTTADRLTQEVLATRAPVLVRNALTDPRTVRSVMQNFGVHSILGVPMLVRDEVIGLLYLDNEEDPHPFSDEHTSIASTFAQLAGVAILQAQRSTDLRTNMRTIARQNELLRQSTAIEERLSRLVLEGGTLADIAEAAAELTGKPCTIHDGAYRRVAVARPPGLDSLNTTVLAPEYRALPDVQDALGGMKPNRTAVIGPLPAAGLLHRYLVTPIALRDEAGGFLVLMEFGSRFSALDAAVSRRAATAAALELSVERRAAVADRYARRAFVRDLLTGFDDQPALLRRGELLGFDMSAPHVVALLSAHGAGESTGPSAVEAAWAAIGQPEPMWFSTAPRNGLAILIKLDEAVSRAAAMAEVTQVVERLQAQLPATPTVAAISAVCTEPTDYDDGFREAERILKCLRSLRGNADGGPTVLSAHELGAGRLLLEMVERDEADRFTRNTLGPLLAGGNRTIEELLVTVRVFFENGRSVRNSARFLSVHENTIRYRLGRVLELTGLDIATDSDDQLSAQVALLILKIQGRLP